MSFRMIAPKLFQSNKQQKKDMILLYYAADDIVVFGKEFGHEDMHVSFLDYCRENNIPLKSDYYDTTGYLSETGGYIMLTDHDESHFYPILKHLLQRRIITGDSNFAYYSEGEKTTLPVKDYISGKGSSVKFGGGMDEKERSGQGGMAAARAFASRNTSQYDPQGKYQYNRLGDTVKMVGFRQFVE